MGKEQETILDGEVIEALPNTMFRVRYGEGNEQVAYLSGRMKLHRIRVLVGDKVKSFRIRMEEKDVLSNVRRYARIGVLRLIRRAMVVEVIVFGCSYAASGGMCASES
jgi:translation initiation factor IF-1